MRSLEEWQSQVLEHYKVSETSGILGTGKGLEACDFPENDITKRIPNVLILTTATVTSLVLRSSGGPSLVVRSSGGPSLVVRSSGGSSLVVRSSGGPSLVVRSSGGPSHQHSMTSLVTCT